MHRGKQFALGWYPWYWPIRNNNRNHPAIAVFIVAVLPWVFLLLPGRVCAVESHPSTTSVSARQDALRAIPLAKISARYGPRVRSVLEHATLYRRLPTCVVDCHPDLFTYVARNPEVMVAIWRELGVSHIQLNRTGPNTFDLRDSVGTTGKLILVEQQCDADAQNRLVLLAEGTYEGKPLTKPIKAQCVLLLRSGSIQETNGRTFVAARLDTFIRFDRAGVQLFAKAIHPWVGITADRNFRDTLTFVSNLSHAAEIRPESVGRLAGRLPGITPDRQKQLSQIAYQCADDSRQWQVDHPDQHKLQQARLARFTKGAEDEGESRQ